MSIVGSPQWMYNASTAFYPFEISNSLRLNDDDSAFLSFTPSSAGNQKTFTFSCWVKLGNLGTSRSLFARHDSGSDTFVFRFDGNNNIQVENFVSSYQLHLVTDAEFRDVGAWYNVILRIDTTQSTDTDRARIYVNGTEQTSFSTSVYPSQNADLKVNADASHVIGARASGSFQFDGYLTDISFIDGGSLAPSSFGETKENIWIPKNTSGLTFGTNGFRLQFKNSSVASASSSTIGADTSGNDNHFASTNVATTDNMVDTPTDNFCVMNLIGHSDGATPGTLSEGNLVVNTGNAKTITYGTFAIPTSGKYYFEVTAGTTNSTQLGLAVRRDGSTFRSFSYRSNGDSVTNTTVSSVAPFASFTSGDVIGVAVDSDTPDVEFFKNGSSQGSINIDFSLDSGDLFPFVTDTNSGASCVVTFNFGATAFAQTVPSGFDKKLSTADLPSPAVGDPEEAENPTDYFSIKTYTGNGSTQSITGVGLQSDWTWIKNRSAADAHALTDSVRGVTKELQSNATTAESTNADGLTAFGADGFSLGDDDIYNTNTESYVSWNWKAGTAFSNDAGSNGATITSSGSTNQEAGFSIVSYSGNSTSGATVFHNLSASVAMIIVKDRSEARAWCVYHKELADDNKLNLNSTGAAALPGTLQFDTSANTTSVFGLGNNTATNNSSENYIAYVFSEKSGYSKFGSYVGNGDADGTFIFLNFRPSWILIKRTDSADDWMIVDTARADVVDRNPVDNILESNTSDAEESGLPCNFNSNGFKIKTTDAAFNADGGNYIYMAFADQPLKFANSR